MSFVEQYCHACLGGETVDFHFIDMLLQQFKIEIPKAKVITFTSINEVIHYIYYQALNKAITEVFEQNKVLVKWLIEANGVTSYLLIETEYNYWYAVQSYDELVEVLIDL